MYYICFCKQTKTKKMSKIIDIEALSKMPITDEFAKMIFKDLVDKSKFKVSLTNYNLLYHYEYKKHSLLQFSIENNGEIQKCCIDSNGIRFMDFDNAFQIVRYIDNYLNSLPKIDKVVIDKMRDVIIIEKLKNDNIIEVGSKLFCGLCGDVLGECEKELQFPFMPSQFTSSLKNMSFYINNIGFHHKTCGHSMFCFTEEWSFVSIEKYNEAVKELQNKKD